VLPISLIARDAPDIVHSALDSQLRSTTPGEYDGRFVRRVEGQSVEGLGPRETDLLARIGHVVHPLGHVLKSRIEQGALKRLVERGLVQVAGLTPSDASHVLGNVDVWDKDAAEKALVLFGRRRTGSGNTLAKEAKLVAGMIVERLTYQTGLALLETAFAEEDPRFDIGEDVLARHVLTQRGLQNHRGLLRLDVGLNLPVVGLGASAATYYPAVGRLMGSEMILPEHAGVANAIGAVVGRVTMRRSGTVTAPSEGLFRLHLETGLEDFGDAETAMERMETVLSGQAIADAKAAGADDIQLRVDRDVRKAEAEAREVFIEATITVEAAGRPRVADG
jgi:N-methylhydantoinase A/oxoprolinase/acetone carboxylase beta subunit